MSKENVTFVPRIIEITILLSVIYVVIQVVSIPIIAMAMTTLVAYVWNNFAFHLENDKTSQKLLLAITIFEILIYPIFISLFLTSVLTPSVVTIALLGSAIICFDFIRNLTMCVNNTHENRSMALAKLSYLGGSFLLKFAVLLSALSLVTTMSLGFILITAATSIPMLIYSQLHEYMFLGQLPKEEIEIIIDDDSWPRPGRVDKSLEFNYMESMNIHSSTETDGNKRCCNFKIFNKITEASEHTAKYERIDPDSYSL